jgi:hypothetical protein
MVYRHTVRLSYHTQLDPKEAQNHGGRHGFVNAKYITASKAGPAVKKVTSAAVMTAAVKNVADTARTSGWNYGDSHSAAPCEDRKISCDRLIARAL